MTATAANPKEMNGKIVRGERLVTKCGDRLTVAFSLPREAQTHQRTRQSRPSPRKSDEVASVTGIKTDSTDQQQDESLKAQTIGRFEGIIEPEGLFSGIVSSSYVAESVKKKDFFNHRGAPRTRVYVTLDKQGSLVTKGEKRRATLSKLSNDAWPQVWALFNKGLYNLGKVTLFKKDNKKEFTMLTLTRVYANTRDSITSLKFEDSYLSVNAA